MDIFTSVSINGCHLLRDLGIVLSRTDCVQPPEPKTNRQDMPGVDGSLDLTENLAGRTLYHNRIITMEFGRGLNRSQWPVMYSHVMERFHGKKVKVIFDDDLSYFYIGRASVSDYKRIQKLGTMMITVEAEPYKYEVFGGLDPWEWDSFNFETGIIREYKNLVVSGRLEVDIIGLSKVTIPIIISNAAMKAEWRGMQFDIKPGNNKIYDIAISEGENKLIFLGTGLVSIDYRGGIL